MTGKRRGPTPRDDSKRRTVTFKISERMWQCLEALAKTEGCGNSVHTYARGIVERTIDAIQKTT